MLEQIVGFNWLHLFLFFRILLLHVLLPCLFLALILYDRCASVSVTAILLFVEVPFIVVQIADELDYL